VIVVVVVAVIVSVFLSLFLSLHSHLHLSLSLQDAGGERCRSRKSDGGARDRHRGFRERVAVEGSRVMLIAAPRESSPRTSNPVIVALGRPTVDVVQGGVPLGVTTENLVPVSGAGPRTRP